MKKCPFCEAEIEDEVINCVYCGGMLDKYKDWEKVLKKKQPEKKHLKTSSLIIAFLCVGPFALPLLWLNPRFSQKRKIIVTVIVIILSYYLTSVFIDSINSTIKYYQQIFNLTL